MINKLPKMIIFDVGGTLFNDGKFEPESGFEALRLHACNPEITSAPVLTKHLYEYLDKVNDAESKLEIPLSSVLKYVAMKTGLRFDNPIYKQEEIFDRFNSTRSVIDGVPELLETLKFLGVRTAVISNNMMSGESLTEAIRFWIPEAEFEFCLTSSDVLFKKPDKNIFESAINFANLNPFDCVYCGDGFIPDVCGSLGVGMNAVLLDQKSDKDFEIKKHEDKEYIAVNNWCSFAEFLKQI